MIVVSDTTPLISLMKIGQLNLIHQLFGEVQIPSAVFDELVSNPRFLNESMQIKSCTFIKKAIISDTHSVELLRRSTGLDAGESEAIVLSDSLHASLLLMDEAKGRQVASQMGIQLMGTIGMLLVAYQENLLSKKDILNCIEILKISGRHISNKLYAQLLQKISE